MAKTIQGTYYVADCEHVGDINNAKRYLSSLGCTITDSYWDGNDCGESYIDFSFLDTRFVELYKKLGHSATFSADINDYINANGNELPYKKMTHKELMAEKERMDNDHSEGFYNRLPLYLFFELTKSHNDPMYILSNVLSFFKEKVKVLGYDIHVVDGATFCDVLMESSYKNLTTQILTNGIGDYCLGRNGWLKFNHIYGECSCTHKTFNTNKLNGYEYIQDIIQKIINKEPLQFRNQDSYYHPKDIIVNASQYLDKNENFNHKMTKDNKTYTIKDPRFWNNFVA